MEESLASIKQLCASIKSMEFSSPGIFTNAMITRPELTTLIRDALLAEQQLYKISSSNVRPGVTAREENLSKRLHSGEYREDPFQELQPERIDGRDVLGLNTPVRKQKTAIISPAVSAKLPKIDDAMSLPTKRKIASQYSLIRKEVIESDNPIEMCDAILAIDQETPTVRGLFQSRQRALLLKLEYERLMKEIESFGSRGHLVDAEGQDIVYNLLTNEMNELIAKEQAEIERLEKQLELV